MFTVPASSKYLSWGTIITVTSQWRLASGLLVQPTVQASIKEKIEARATGPLWRNTIRDRRINKPHTHTGPVTRKTSPCDDLIMMLSKDV